MGIWLRYFFQMQTGKSRSNLFIKLGLFEFVWFDLLGHFATRSTRIVEIDKYYLLNSIY